MIENVYIRPEAEEDLREATLWYQEQNQPGQSFLDEVGNGLETISEYPEAYPIVHRDLRRFLISKFPFANFLYLS